MTPFYWSLLHQCCHDLMACFGPTLVYYSGGFLHCTPCFGLACCLAIPGSFLRPEPSVPSMTISMCCNKWLSLWRVFLTERYFNMSASWWCKKKCQGITRVISKHGLETMIICTKFHIATLLTKTLKILTRCEKTLLKSSCSTVFSH